MFEHVSVYVCASCLPRSRCCLLHVYGRFIGVEISPFPVARSSNIFRGGPRVRHFSLICATQSDVCGGSPAGRTGANRSRKSMWGSRPSSRSRRHVPWGRWGLRGSWLYHQSRGSSSCASATGRWSEPRRPSRVRMPNHITTSSGLLRDFGPVRFFRVRAGRVVSTCALLTHRARPAATNN